MYLNDGGGTQSADVGVNGEPDVPAVLARK